MASVARQEINIIALTCILCAPTPRYFRVGNARAVPIWPGARVFFGTEPCPSKHHLTGPQSAQFILSGTNELGLLRDTIT